MGYLISRGVLSLRPPLSLRGRLFIMPHLLACLILLTLATLSGDAYAQQRSYWLRQGGEIIGSCPNERQGLPLKAANRDGGWILITAVINCRDTGGHYSFEVSFARVAINSRSRSGINRDALNFDWFGLAVYQPQGNGQSINWLYDEALPIRGTLRKESDNEIYFGNLKFDVAKADIARASNFLFYMTSEGVIYNFGLLP